MRKLFSIIVNNIISFTLLSFLSCALLSGCSSQAADDGPDPQAEEEAAQVKDVEISARTAETEEEDSQKNAAVFSFVTAQGETMEAYLNEDVPMQSYDWSHLKKDGDIFSYEDDSYTSRWGVDVCSYDGTVDWDKLKDAGASFAFIRIGYRGYGQAGTLCRDDMGLINIKGAQKAGLDTGVYFFSQAINEEEAAEEADLVLEILDGRSLELPVVFDPESILDDEARTDTVTGEQFTKNTLAFCERIREAGYETMVYCNMLWEAYELDLTQLTGLDIWYADYEPEPQTPYDFTFWQYTESGKVPGIDGALDLNLQLIKKEDQDTE